MSDHFLAGEIGNEKPQHAAVHVIPAGLEASVSYGGGTAGGPAAILAASAQLELWDGSGEPALCGIHTTAPVDCSGSVDRVLDRIEDAVVHALECGAVPLVLGGEHTVTLGALRGVKSRFGRFGVVQFDAHADLRDTYDGSPLSHACVMRRAVADLGLPLFQIGVRALCRAEAEFRSERGIGHLDARRLHEHGIPKTLLPADFPDRIYLTFDVDGLDPSVIRSTGTPVPGGIGWWDALLLMERALAGRRLLGADVVELAPTDGGPACAFAAAQLACAIVGLAAAQT